MTRLHDRLRVLAVVLLCLAPVPGDIGSCGQPATELDPPRFFEAKKAIDCLRCDECGYETTLCTRACDLRSQPLRAFEDGCLPLVHDGEVCLRRLLDASCDDYAAYVDDFETVVPSECNFCPREGR